MKPTTTPRAQPREAARLTRPPHAHLQEELRGGASHSGVTPLLVVASDRPELFEGVVPPGYEVAFRDPETLISRLDTGAEDLGLERRRREHDVVFLLDVADDARCAELLARLHALAPRASALVLSDDADLPMPADILARRLAWCELLLPDVELELALLGTRSRVRRLREFTAELEVLPILIQRDPDPDAIASALAVRWLLDRDEKSCPIVSFGEITRPENHRMAELLQARVTRVTQEELAGFARVVTVDVQPVDFHDDTPYFAVIDHHPQESGYSAEFIDIREAYGATATILTEYLRADDEARFSPELAAALLYGIKTDTAALSRGVIPADVTAYAFLQERADRELLARIERPSFSLDVFRAYGRALANVRVEDDVAVAYMGELPPDELHLLPELADTCLAVEEVCWVAAAAAVGEEFIIALRHIGEEPGADALARRMVADGGSGGGHPTMARCAIPLPDALRKFNGGGAAAANEKARSADRAIQDALLACVQQEVRSLH